MFHSFPLLILCSLLIFSGHSAFPAEGDAPTPIPQNQALGWEERESFGYDGSWKTFVFGPGQQSVSVWSWEDLVHRFPDVDAALQRHAPQVPFLNTHGQTHPEKIRHALRQVEPIKKDVPRFFATCNAMNGGGNCALIGSLEEKGASIGIRSQLDASMTVLIDREKRPYILVKDRKTGKQIPPHEAFSMYENGIETPLHVSPQTLPYLRGIQFATSLKEVPIQALYLTRMPEGLIQKCLSVTKIH